jgi:hypothetical protein
MSTIAVSYAMVQQYSTAATIEFCFFLGLILFLWFVNLVGELKAIIQLADFIWSFEHDEKLPLLTPGMRRYWRSFKQGVGRTVSSNSLAPQEEEDTDRLGSDEDDGTHVIYKISRAHKITCTLMCVVRFCLLIYMFHVGSMFLITNHKYDDLLLNAVALAFIFELPEFLYTFLVSDDMKNDLQGAHTAEYVTSLPVKGFSTIFLSKSLWGIVIIPLVAFSLVVFNYQVTTMPSLRALQCTCFQTGEQCEVSNRFSKEWWTPYWKEVAEMFKEGSVFRSYPID